MSTNTHFCRIVCKYKSPFCLPVVCHSFIHSFIISFIHLFVLIAQSEKDDRGLFYLFDFKMNSISKVREKQHWFIGIFSRLNKTQSSSLHFWFGTFHRYNNQNTELKTLYSSVSISLSLLHVSFPFFLLFSNTFSTRFVYFIYRPTCNDTRLLSSLKHRSVHRFTCNIIAIV